MKFSIFEREGVNNFNTKKEIFDITKDIGIDALEIFNQTNESLASNTIPTITMTYFVSRLSKLLGK